MINIEIEDSNVEGCVPDKIWRGNASSVIEAINHLNQDFESNKVKVIPLIKYANFYSPNIRLLSYSIAEFDTIYGNRLPKKVKLYTSHYIGRFRFNQVDIVINPRFGKEIFGYLLQFVGNIYISSQQSGNAFASDNFYSIIALLWKSFLNKAISIGHIPKAYINETSNLKNFRGRLNVSRHISYNLTNQSRFYCQFTKLSPNHLINRTIRYTFRLLAKEKCMPIIAEFNYYDEKLASMGVCNDPVSVREIECISYTRLNYAYRPLMNICKSIILNHSLHSGNEDLITQAYFIDIAELWEIYLLKLLQRNLVGYDVSSPNIHFGEYLLSNSHREIRPDIIIKKSTKVLMVLDAKYKAYSQIGKYAQAGISREDLYQMTTYLYHYGKNNPIVGVFTSPYEQEDISIESFSNCANQRLAVINLQIDNIKLESPISQQIKNREEEFLSHIKNLLKSVECMI